MLGETKVRISLTDPRLSQGERRFLRDVAEKLREPRTGEPLPESYREALDQCFGSCGEGDRDRWQPKRPAT
jgi:hypothetical protein